MREVEKHECRRTVHWAVPKSKVLTKGFNRKKDQKALLEERECSNMKNWVFNYGDTAVSHPPDHKNTFHLLGEFYISSSFIVSICQFCNTEASFKFATTLSLSHTWKTMRPLWKF